MTFRGSPPPIDRRQSEERRLEAERRTGANRRADDPPALAVPIERRLGGDRRSGGERRALMERRLSLQSAVDQIHGALKLLTIVGDGAPLGEQQRRNLEAAMLRLRFALERMEGRA